MNENIVVYLRENKDKYSKEILINELKNVGYGEEDIRESANFVYEEKMQNSVDFSNKNNSFWNFHDKKEYLKSSEKWKDFLFGFFTPYLGAFLGFVPLAGFILFGFEIFVAVYLFNRRRFISYGIIFNFLLGILIMMVFLVGLISMNYFQ